VIGAPLAGLLLSLDGFWGLHGWQWMYLIEGLPAILLTGAVLRLLTDHPDHADWLTPAQRNWLSSRIRAEHAAAGARHSHSVRAALLHPVVWLLAFLAFAFQTGSYGLQFWTPQIVKSWSGLDPLGVGLVTAIPYLAAAVGMVLIGRSSDRSGERFFHIAVPSLVGALGFIAAAFVISPVLGVLALTVAAVGDMGTRGPFWSLPTRFLTAAASAGGIALINTVGSLGGFVGPFAVGLVKDATGLYAGGLLLMALLLTLGAVVAVGLRKRDELKPITESGH
jgi:ACS family tartrate transporter-like MFS transporter